MRPKNKNSCQGTHHGFMPMWLKKINGAEKSMFCVFNHSPRKYPTFHLSCQFFHNTAWVMRFFPFLFTTSHLNLSEFLHSYYRALCSHTVHAANTFGNVTFIQRFMIVFLSFFFDIVSMKKWYATQQKMSFTVHFWSFSGPGTCRRMLLVLGVSQKLHLPVSYENSLVNRQ